MRPYILSCCLLSLLALSPAFAYAQGGIGGTVVKTPDAPFTIWRSDMAVNDAEALMRQRKFVDALTILDQVINRNIRNADAHVDTALIWLNLGNMDKARSAITNALAIDKGHMGAYVVSALIALKNKDRQQAEAFLSALRVVGKGEQTPEFQYLQKTIREADIK